MVVWMSIALNQGQWIMAAFGSIHALVGLGLIYFCVANFLNKTRMERARTLQLTSTYF